MKHDLIETIYHRILHEATVDAARAGAQALDDMWGKMSKKERHDATETLFPPRAHLKGEELETLGNTPKYAEDEVWRRVVVPFKEKTKSLYVTFPTWLSVKSPGKEMFGMLKYYEKYLTLGAWSGGEEQEMRERRDILRDFLTNDPAGYMSSVLRAAKKIREDEAEAAVKDFSATSGEHTPEAPLKSPLGGWAFATKRRGVPPEPDTATEKKLYTALLNHVKYNAGLSQWAVGQIKKYIERDWYTPVFTKPTVAKVYRGTKVDARFIRRVAGIPEGQPIPVTGETETSEILPTRPPRSSTTSWTPTLSVAEKFAGRGNEDGVYRSSPNSYSVVLTAETADNVGSFMEMTSELYGIVDPAFQHEAEVFGLGPVKMSHISWQRGRYYDE